MWKRFYSNSGLVLLTILALSATAAAQAQPDPDCKVRVMVLKHDWEDIAKLKRHTFSRHQSEWWKKNSKKFPGVCLVTTEPADYLLMWTETWTSVPYIATTPVTTAHSGTVETDSGRTGTYKGTSTTYETRREEWHHWWVEANLFKLESGKPLPEPVFKAEHHGRWRWSKPDKDAFEKALKRVRDLASPIDKP